MPTVPTEKFVPCAISQNVNASIIHDQAFHALNIHSNDSCGPKNPLRSGSSLTARTAIFETFSPFIRLTATEGLITGLCLKSAIDIRWFYAFVREKLPSPHAVPCTH